MEKLKSQKERVDMMKAFEKTMPSRSAGGFLSSPDEDRDLITMNFPNGAHHSDLSHRMPDPTSDTPDITEGRERAVGILARWLEGGGRENTLWI